MLVLPGRGQDCTSALVPLQVISLEADESVEQTTACALRDASLGRILGRDSVCLEPGVGLGVTSSKDLLCAVSHCNECCG